MPEIDTKSLESKYPELVGKFSVALEGIENFRDQLSLTVNRGSLRGIVSLLKDTYGFDMLMDLFGMDYLKYRPETPERFAVIYILFSTTRNEHLRLKVYLPEADPTLESLHDVYKAVNWFEREAWDLFGITFSGHPNLTRILCHVDFEGHPLRKDYPANGFQRLKTALPASGL